MCSDQEHLQNERTIVAVAITREVETKALDNAKFILIVMVAIYSRRYLSIFHLR